MIQYEWRFTTAHSSRVVAAGVAKLVAFQYVVAGTVQIPVPGEIVG